METWPHRILILAEASIQEFVYLLVCLLFMCVLMFGYACVHMLQNVDMEDRIRFAGAGPLRPWIGGSLRLLNSAEVYHYPLSILNDSIGV